MKKDNQFVALVHHICPYCADKCGEEILFHKRLGDLSEYDGQATGWEVCEECQKGLDMGGIGVIIADQDKSRSNQLRDLYRCGIVHFMTRESIERMLKDSALLDDVLEKKMLVIDYRVARHMGFEINYPPKPKEVT